MTWGELIARANVPAWVALAAHQSGIPLPETLQIYRGLRDRLDEDPAPTTIPEWADLVIDLLGHLPVPRPQAHPARQPLQ